jgi:hypothetical protein
MQKKKKLRTSPSAYARAPPPASPGRPHARHLRPSRVGRWGRGRRQDLEPAPRRLLGTARACRDPAHASHAHRGPALAGCSPLPPAIPEKKEGERRDRKDKKGLRIQ